MQTIECEKESGVYSVVLARTDKSNALNSQMMDELRTVFDRIANDEDARALILTAKGKHFCAGADLNWMAECAAMSEAANRSEATRFGEMLSAFYALPVVTLSCVQGSCLGGAIGLVAASDIAVAHPQARFCFSEVKLGLVPAMVSPYVVSAIGGRQAKRLFLSAEQFNAEQAQAFGLIHEVVGEFDEWLNAILPDLLACDGHAQKQSKALLQATAMPEVNELMIELSYEVIARARATPESKARIERFLSSRGDKR